MYRIVVDVRERSLIAELAEDAIETKALLVGDIEIHASDPGSPTVALADESQCDGGAEQPSPQQRPLLVVERKTVADLAASIRDGRWSEQKRRMMETAGRERVAYVIEGQLPRWDDDDGGVHCGMSSKRLLGALSSLLLRHRVPVVYTRDVADTAAFLRRAGALLTAAPPPPSACGGYAGAACRASAVRAKKRDNVDGRQCYLQQLCQVPGVSYGLATAIAGTPGFGSMRELLGTLEALPTAKARSAALQRVPKVGKAIAEQLLEKHMFTAGGVELLT